MNRLQTTSARTRTAGLSGLLFATIVSCTQSGLNGVSAHLAIQAKTAHVSAGVYTLDFGSVVTGTTATVVVSALDSGKAPLTLQAPSVTTPFAVDLAAAIQIVGAGHSDLTFSFTPTAEGDIQQSVDLQSDAGNAHLLLKGKGVPPRDCTFVIMPTRLDFGTIVKGQSKTAAVQFANLGGEDCSLADIHVDPSSDPAFSLPPGEPTSGVASWTGGSYPLRVTFAPMREGTDFSGKLSLLVGPSATPVEVPLVGAAVPAPCAAVVQPDTFRFNSILAGQTATQTVNVVATGPTPCALTGVTLDGGSDPTFTLAAGQATDGVATMGSPFPISVVFSPTSAANDLTGRLLFHSGPPDTVMFVPIIGNVTPCRFHMVPATADFGSVVPGIPVTKTVRVVSDGPQTCTISNLRLDPTTNPDFALAGGQPLTGTSTMANSFSIGLTYTPFQPGPTAMGALLFDVAEPLAPQTVPLSGTAICPQPAFDGSCPGTLMVQPTTIDFGVVTAGCRSREKAVTLTATGANPVTIQGFSETPAGPPDVFPYTLPATPFVIGPGTSVKLPMRFTPPDVVGYTGSLLVRSTAVNVPVGSAGLSVGLAGTGTSISHVTDMFAEGGSPRTDVLLVVDDSGSMAEEQGLLADNAIKFINIADQMLADYQIAVTTTDVDNPFESGNFQGSPKIVLPGPNAASQLATTVRALGVGGSGHEQGMQGMYLALTDPLISTTGQNQGFLRQDARLAVVIISDEDDQSPETVDFYANFLANIKGAGNASLVTFSAVVGPTALESGTGQAGCTSANGMAVEGPRYIDLQTRTGGVFRSICSADWGAIATDLGLNVFNSRNTFSLSRPADPATLVVHVAGALVDSSHYRLDTVTNVVTFNAGSEPGPGAAILFDYEAICL